MNHCTKQQQQQQRTSRSHTNFILSYIPSECLKHFRQLWTNLSIQLFLPFHFYFLSSSTSSYNTPTSGLWLHHSHRILPLSSSPQREACMNQSEHYNTDGATLPFNTLFNCERTQLSLSLGTLFFQMLYHSLNISLTVIYTLSPLQFLFI